MSARAGRALMQQNWYAILRIPKNQAGRKMAHYENDHPPNTCIG
jgi:hypothetical protein